MHKGQRGGGVESPGSYPGQLIVSSVGAEKVSLCKIIIATDFWIMKEMRTQSVWGWIIDRIVLCPNFKLIVVVSYAWTLSDVWPAFAYIPPAWAPIWHLFRPLLSLFFSVFPFRFPFPSAWAIIIAAWVMTLPAGTAIKLQVGVRANSDSNPLGKLCL